MTDRRKFLSTSGLLLTGAVVSKKAVGQGGPNSATEVSSLQAFEQFEDFYPGPPGTQQTKASARFEKLTPTSYASFAQRVSSPSPVDAVVGIAESAINKFLQAHFTDNPGIYNRSRESKQSPIYQASFDDHGVQRVFKFFAAVRQDPGKPPLFLNLAPGPEQSAKLRAWWRSRSRGASVKADSPIPPNVELLVPHIVVQIDFPKLGSAASDPDPEHHVDINYLVDVRAYLNLANDTSNATVITMTDWDILLTPVDDPLNPPADYIWGKIKPGCEQELTEARLALRDLITIGANITLTELCKTFTRSLPFPPIDVVKGARLTPRELFIADRHIGVSASLTPVTSNLEAISEFASTMKVVQDQLMSLDFSAVSTRSDEFDQRSFHNYALRHSPAYKALFLRNEELLKRTNEPQLAAAPVPIPQNDFFVMLSSNFFDQLARSFLSDNVQNCTPWKEISLAVAYLRGRACYWLQLTGAHGAVNGTNISMGCGVNVGGNLDLEACLHVLCAPDACTSWSPGLGLKGPLNLTLELIEMTWSKNSALILHPRVDSFPGLQVYGFFDPLTQDIVNFLLGLISGAVLTAFLNALFSSLYFPIIQIPLVVPKTNVKLQLDHFGAGNVNGLLTITGTTNFS